MVEFVTLFLGLVLGVQPVVVLAGDDVVAVELLLDGRPIGRAAGPSWSLPCDFGDQVEPHLLEAVAYGDDGGELSRARQWLNLPRPAAEARVVVEPGDGGVGAVARLTWESLVSAEPRAISASLDGRAVEVSNLARIELPPHDPEQLHFLRIELDFSDTVTSVVETTFGGGFADTVSAELTAIAVELVRPGREPGIEDLQGLVSKSGLALRVLALDKTPAEVVIVRDQGAQEAILEMARRRLGVRRSVRQLPTPLSSASSLRFSARLKKGHRISLLSPFAQTVQRDSFEMELFPPSREFSREDGGLFWLLTQVQPALATPERQRLADAVAVAGLSAASRNRRRAVVLIVGDHPSDASQLGPRQSRHYLKHLGVPLLVWRVEGDGQGTSDGWGQGTRIDDLSAMESAAKELSRLLERQRIIWLEGVHLPQEIAISGAATGIRPVIDPAD